MKPSEIFILMINKQLYITINPYRLGRVRDDVNMRELIPQSLIN